MKRYFIVIILFLFFQCASTNGSWSRYSIQYFGSEVEMNTFLKELTAKKCEYKVQAYDGGVYEVKYKDSVKKN